MDKMYQDLVSELSGKQPLVLTSLLSGMDHDSWEQNKHIIVSHMPFLTLEMAVNRICHRKQHSIPSPAQIYQALQYARSKQLQHEETQSPFAIKKNAFPL